ncbi:MAG: transglycosylase SLT domain-containing protein [Prevotella sp.]|nr:transglycosylase SLT domain-containing protein [Prevotella sp.]
MKRIVLFILGVVGLLLSCNERQDNRVITPWGEVQTDSIPTTEDFTLKDIVSNGEMIMLTLSGPETYYDYHGRGMGAQFLLCEKFAQSIGVSLRVELCKDTMEMVWKLGRGEADVIAYMLSDSIVKHLPDSIIGSDGLRFCGAYQTVPDSTKIQWVVSSTNSELAEAFDHWYKPDMLEEIKQEEHRLLTTASVKRHVYSPFLNRSTGVISKYDDLFRKYAPLARWDWRLMAAQCYQESCFDPKARSWAGARGLMQIMPGTAAHLGLSMDDIHAPEPNISAAARYLQELSNTFSDIPNVTERQNFVLAAYNGGAMHVRDAMALTRKNGGNPQRWGDVARNMLLLREPVGYQDPVVKHGYMRAGETVDYVDKIRARYAQYRGVPMGKLPSSSGSFSPVAPRKAKKKYKYHV